MCILVKYFFQLILLFLFLSLSFTHLSLSLSLSFSSMQWTWTFLSIFYSKHLQYIVCMCCAVCVWYISGLNRTYRFLFSWFVVFMSNEKKKNWQSKDRKFLVGVSVANKEQQREWKSYTWRKLFCWLENSGKMMCNLLHLLKKWIHIWCVLCSQMYSIHTWEKILHTHA